MATMQNIIARTTRAPGEGHENASAKPIAEIEGAFREFAQRDGGSSSAKVSSDTAANVDGGPAGQIPSPIEEFDELAWRVRSPRVQSWW